MGLEELGLLLCTHVWKVGRWALFGINGILVAKVVLSFLVVILNYVISKFLVFSNQREKVEKVGSGNASFADCTGV